jgi:hypothetical protein
MFDSTYLHGRDMHIRLNERHAERDQRRLRLIARGENGFSVGSFVNSATTRVGKFADALSDGVQAVVAGPQEPSGECC